MTRLIHAEFNGRTPAERADLPPHLFFILVIPFVVLLAPLRPAHSEPETEFKAERITLENFEERHVGGPDSIAGIDDWFLSNGIVCAAISDVDHMSAIAAQGGVLIDLGHCDAGDDQWTVLQPILNLSMAKIAPVTRIEAGTDGDRAWLRTRAIAFGIEILTTYALDAKTPRALSVTIRAQRIDEGGRLFSIGSVVLHPSGQTPAFSLLRTDLDRSLGFVYPPSGGQSALALMRSLASSDLTVLVGGDEMPPISYGIERVSTTFGEDDEAVPLASFSVTGRHFTLLNSLTRPLWFDRGNKPPGVFQFMQLPFIDLERNSEFVSFSRIWVGQRADVASITDQLWKNAPQILGTVDDATARIHIDGVNGTPITEIRPDTDGKFSVRLPTGNYRARALAPAGRTAEVPFEVFADESRQTIPPLKLGASGWVVLPERMIGRLLFLNQDGSGPMIFGDHQLGFRIGEELIPSGLEAPYINLAESPLDPKRVRVAPGRYRVIAVRGPEYDATETLIEVRAGDQTRLDLEPLPRVAKTPGWISADLHVHSGESFDSSLPQSKQIIAFAASGAEVLVATEHDRIFDPRPAIRRSGLADRLVAITGVEVTSAVGGADSPHTSAHLNAFPTEPTRGLFRNGAPSLERNRLSDTLAEIREFHSSPFIQLNHPRSALDVPEDDTYFSHLGEMGRPFDPTRRLSEAPNSSLREKNSKHDIRDLDFHGVELLNAQSLLRYRRVRADWLSLMLQGERIIGTSNSDSHRLGVIVGLPRTYVQLEDDTLEGFDEARFMKSLREGRAYGSTGPLLTVRLDDAGLGELHEGPSGTLVIKVDAAPWVPVAEWRAYVNGELVHRAPIGAGDEASLPLVFERDAFVTVEVEGPAEGLYRDALPDFVPFAFTNPIFVDVDGNGRFDAPGLPDVLPRTLANPDRPD